MQKAALYAMVGLAASVVQASEDSFRFETVPSYSTTKYSDGGAAEWDGYQNVGSVRASYYFDPLPKQTSYPLALAPFIERVGHVAVYAHANKGEFKRKYMNGAAKVSETREFEGNSKALELYLWSPESALAGDVYYGKGTSKTKEKEVLQAGYTWTSTGTDTRTFNYETDRTYYTGKVRYYFAKTLMGGMKYQKDSYDTNGSTYEIKEYGPHAEYMTAVGPYYFWASGEALRRTDSTRENSVLFLDLAFYPTTRLGVGGSVRKESGDMRSDTGTRVMAGFRWFFSPTLELGGGMERLSAKDTNPDESVLFGSLSVRF